MRAQILAMMGRPDEARPLLDAPDRGRRGAGGCAASPARPRDPDRHRLGRGRCRRRQPSQRGRHALAEKSGNPYLLVYGRGYAAIAQSLRGEHEAAAQTLAETLAMRAGAMPGWRTRRACWPTWRTC
jgi:hypothetical protein